MTNRTSPQQEHRESGPLKPAELSKDEVLAILSIERRLGDARAEPDFKEHDYLFDARDRYARVLLLDGGRGTGKTALLLTLAKWWNEKKEDWEKIDKERKEAFKGKLEGQVEAIPSIPRHVQVLDILDFDPIPPGMPLLAGIIQAWRRLAEYYERCISPQVQNRCEDYGGEVMDSWYHLFSMAAVGWTSVPIKEGLVEQVLDRQEQAHDWQRLGTHWRRFVDKVLKVGSSLPPEERVERNQVFVIMIDDVDLQVERIRELLPALRLLYHPQVFFLVAADSSHMIDMLKLDFLGKENSLAYHRGSDSALVAGNEDHWATLLAKSSFEKVFALKNRQFLGQLSLRKFLEHHAGVRALKDPQWSFQAILNNWDQRRNGEGRELGPLGDYLAKVSGTGEGAMLLQRFMPYRSVVQIYDRAQELHDGRSGPEAESDSGSPSPDDDERRSDLRRRRLSAQEVIRNMIGRTDVDRLIRRTTQKDPRNVNEELLGIDYLATGKLSAEFPKEFADDIDYGGEIVLSSQPDIVYTEGTPGVKTSAATSPNKDPVLSAIIAVSLRDDHYGVVAPGLQWNIPHALAWTNVRVSEYIRLRANVSTHEVANKYPSMTFQWRMYEHPSPLRLLQWSSDWAGFVRDLASTTDDLDERICYGWIYFQLQWSGSELGKLNVKDPFHADFRDRSKRKEMWLTLLQVTPEGPEKETKWWKLRTLPLLARPELGLPAHVHELLIDEFVKAIGPPSQKGLPTDDHYEWLKEQRLKFITDAIVAANPIATDAENEGNAKRVRDTFEARFLRRNTKHSRWHDAIEKRSRKTTK